MKRLFISLYALTCSLAAVAAPVSSPFTTQAGSNRPYLLAFPLAVVCIIVILLIWTRKR